MAYKRESIKLLAHRYKKWPFDLLFEIWKKNPVINRHRQNFFDENSCSGEFRLRILQRSYAPALNSFLRDCSWSCWETLMGLLILGHNLAKLHIRGMGLLTHWHTDTGRSVVTLWRLIGLLTRERIFTELCLYSHLCFKFSLTLFDGYEAPQCLNWLCQFLLCNLQLSVPSKHTKTLPISASQQESYRQQVALPWQQH